MSSGLKVVRDSVMVGGEGQGSWGALQVEETTSAKALSVAERRVSWRLEWWAVSHLVMTPECCCRILNQGVTLPGLCLKFILKP